MWMTFWFVGTLLLRLYVGVHTTLKPRAVFKLRLAALRQEKRLPRAWVPLLLELQEVINTTPSRMLPRHMTPFEVWFGRQPHWIVSPNLPLCILIYMLIPISEDEPLNADESEETEALILTAIEERVRVRNERNAALMRVGNPVLATEVFDRGSIVSLFIPKPIRLTGEVKRNILIYRWTSDARRWRG
jgi:hypothetical protein